MGEAEQGNTLVPCPSSYQTRMFLGAIHPEAELVVLRVVILDSSPCRSPSSHSRSWPTLELEAEAAGGLQAAQAGTTSNRRCGSSPSTGRMYRCCASRWVRQKRRQGGPSPRRY